MGVHSCLSNDHWMLCPSAGNVSQRSTLSRHKTEAVYTGIKERHKMVRLTAQGSVTCPRGTPAHYTALDCRRGCDAKCHWLFRLSCLKPFVPLVAWPFCWAIEMPVVSALFLPTFAAGTAAAEGRGGLLGSRFTIRRLMLSQNMPAHTPTVSPA